MFALGLHFRRENEKRAQQQAKNRSLAAVRLQNQRATHHRADSTTSVLSNQNQSKNHHQQQQRRPNTSTTLTPSPRPTPLLHGEMPVCNLPSRSISAPGAVVVPPAAESHPSNNKRSGSSKTRNTERVEIHSSTKSGSKSTGLQTSASMPRVAIAHQFLQPTGLLDDETSPRSNTGIKKTSK